MKQRIARQTIAMLVFWLGSVAAGLALDEVAYRAVMDKRKIKLDGKIQYMLEVDYPIDTSVPNITPPPFSQFTIIDTYKETKEMGQGQEKFLRLQIKWLLEPKQAGRIPVSSSRLAYQDTTSNLLKTGMTGVFFVEVEKEGGKPPPVVEKKIMSFKGRVWLIGVIAALIAGLAILISLFLLRIKTKPSPVARTIEHEVLRSLEQTGELLEQEKVGEYYALLTRILLEYIKDKFGLEAYVLSTGLLLEKLSHFRIPKEHIIRLEDFFRVADKVKFAGHIPESEETLRLHTMVKDFIKAGRAVKPKEIGGRENHA